MIELRVAVVKAIDPNPVPDPIFYLAGGPGSAATEDAEKAQQISFSLSKNHDLVFVDQRGTGGSNQVDVPSDQLDLTGLPPAEFDVRAKEWVAQALAKIDMDPRFYTTSVAMDDLDEMRQVLGYDKINLVGYSYGAIAAQYYLRQHEAHVRTVMLGGGSLLETPTVELRALNGQRVLENLFDRCQTDAACHRAFPNLRTEFAALMARLAAQPVTQTYTTADGQPASVTFTHDGFAGFVRYATRDSRNFSRLPRLIHRAYQGDDWQDITQLFASGVGPEWWSDLVMDRVIRCSEKWAVFNPDAVARLSEGTYFKGLDVDLAQRQAFSCKYTPPGETPEGQSAQPGSQVPVLIWNGQVDYVNPPENMAGAKMLWPNSVALVAPYQGHSVSGFTTVNCYFSVMDQFIQSGSVEGLQTDCLRDITPPPFDTRD
jgi:pimeloyl-ACP methyl ester carboxylesterase